MKRITLFLWFAVGAVLAGCATSHTQQNTAANNRPVRMQLTVDLPASMFTIYDQEIAEAFAYRVASILHEQGFRGRIKYIDDGNFVPNAPVLAVNLQEWRVDRIGNVDCTFTAAIRGPRGEQRLGIFSGTAIMIWPRRDWYARAEGFEDAARQAITELADRLEQSGVLEPVGGATT